MIYLQYSKPTMKSIIFALLLSLSSRGQAKSARIIGGQDTYAGQYPFLAAIQVQTSDGTFFCGGAIYNQEWVITSGSCVNNAVLFTITVGTNLLNGDDTNRVTVSTSDYLAHPDYNPETFENDIGLIKFRMPIKYNQYVQPIYLPAAGISPGETVISVGWGQTSDASSTFSNTLQYVMTNALSNDECKTYYGNQINDNMVCVEGNFNEGTCHGDTGTPLLDHYMYRFHYILGVASFISGNGCESTDPSGYTRILPYTDWIRTTTAEN